MTIDDLIKTYGTDTISIILRQLCRSAALLDDDRAALINIANELQSALRTYHGTVTDLTEAQREDIRRLQ